MNTNGYADLLNTSYLNADSLVVGILILPNLDSNSVPIVDSSNNLSDVVLHNGQLVIGRTGSSPIAANLTGTIDQINVTNGSGSITLSLPQNIATTSSPTFNNITVNNINGKIANDLVTSSSSSTNNNLCVFDGTTGKIIQDSFIASDDVFLRNGSIPATGNFNINNNQIQNVKVLSFNDSNINIGNSTTLPLGGIGNIVFGDFLIVTANNSVYWFTKCCSW